MNKTRKIITVAFICTLAQSACFEGPMDEIRPAAKTDTDDTVETRTQSDTIMTVKIYFYGKIKGYTIRNMNLRIGGNEYLIPEVSNNKHNPTEIVLVNPVRVPKMTATMDVVCVDGVTYHIEKAEFDVNGRFYDGSEIKFGITDTMLGLVPIEFNATVDDWKDESSSSDVP